LAIPRGDAHGRLEWKIEAHFEGASALALALVIASALFVERHVAEHGSGATGFTKTEGAKLGSERGSEGEGDIGKERVVTRIGVEGQRIIHSPRPRRRLAFSVICFALWHSLLVVLTGDLFHFFHFFFLVTALLSTKGYYSRGEQEHCCRNRWKQLRAAARALAQPRGSGQKPNPRGADEGKISNFLVFFPLSWRPLCSTASIR